MVKKILVLIYFLSVSLYATFPLVLHLTSALPGTGDEMLISWILNWDIYALTHNPFLLFQGNIFYPYANSLTFSDLHLTSSILGSIPLMLFGEPAIVYNLNLIFSFAFLGFATYVLTHYLTKSHLPSVVSGTLIAFSTYTVTKTMHLQLLLIGFVPLSLLFFLKYAKSRKTKDLFLMYLFFYLQTINSFLPGYFLVICFGFFLIYFFFFEKKLLMSFLNKKVFLGGVLTLLLLLPIGIPYVQTSRTFDYVRDIRDTIHFANRPEYIFYPSDHTKLQNVLIQTFYEHNTGPYLYDGYIGLAFWVLFICLIQFTLKLKTDKSYLKAFFFLSIFSFILSLGPALQWGGKVIKLPFIIPLPYALFYYLMPGFKGLRNSGRWEILFVLIGSVCIGIMLQKLLEHRPKYLQIGIPLVICFIVIAEMTVPIKITQVATKKEIPQLYYYLNSLPQNATLIEMPIYNWNMYPYSMIEIEREYYSTVHFRKMVNGASGFSPPQWEKDLTFLLTEFPNEETIEYLRKIQVSYVVVHKNEYDVLSQKKFEVNNKVIPKGETIIQSLNNNPKLSLVKKIGNDYIYHLK